MKYHFILQRSLAAASMSKEIRKVMLHVRVQHRFAAIKNFQEYLMGMALLPSIYAY